MSKRAPAGSRISTRNGLRLVSAGADAQDVAVDLGDASAIEKLARLAAPASLVVELDLPDQTAIEITIRIKTRDLAIRQPEPACDLNTDSKYREPPARVNRQILDREDSAEILRAIRAVLVRREYTGVNGTARSDMGKEAQTKCASTAPPTPRQLEIMRMIASGVTSQDIAAILNISVLTVRTHRQNLMKKLRLRNTADITVYAMRHGLCTSL